MFDTSWEAARIQADVLRRLSPEQRLRLAFEMSETARELARTRLRREHPDWEESRVRAELLRGLIPVGHPLAP